MESVAFYEELMSELSKECDDTNTCLISGERLRDHHIKLECNHKFNYENIYNEVVRQKSGFNTLEVQKLRINQIKCPYCRNIQDSLLPPNKSCESIYGVNKPLKYCMIVNTCGAILKSGARKGNICKKPCLEKFCNYHKKTNNEEIKEMITCSALLKSGKRKGETCKNKPKQNGLCLRHFKMN